jgi:hypothetical protein
MCRYGLVRGVREKAKRFGGPYPSLRPACLRSAYAADNPIPINIRTPHLRLGGLQPGGLMSEFFTQELLNSFFCLFCKALCVLNRVSVSNFSWQDP